MIKMSAKYKALAVVFLCLFTIALGFGVILPVLPFYTERLALDAGASPESVTLHIGFLTSAYPFFQMFFAPLWGRWSDRLGRKPLIIVGLSGFILMQLFTGIATSLWMLYGARVIGGIFTSSVIPVGYAVVSDLTSEKRRTLGIALAGASYSSGVLAGPFIGGLLSRTNLHFNQGWGHFLINDYSVPFFFLVVIGMSLLPVASKWLKNPKGIHDKEPINSEMAKWPQLMRNLFLFLLLSFIYQVALTLFESVFSIYSKNVLQYDALAIGYGFMVCALMMGILQPVVVSQKVKKIISGRNQIILGFCVFGICMPLLLITGRLFFVLALVGLLATGGAFVIPNLTSIITLKGKPYMGQALGIQNSVNSLGQVIGPIAGSWLLAVNESLPYLLAGIAVIFVALFLAGSKRFGAVTV